MSKEANGGAISLNHEKGRLTQKVITRENVRFGHVRRQSPLQKKLEEQIQKAKIANGSGTSSNGSLKAAHNGRNSVQSNGKSRCHGIDEAVPLFSMESDSDDEINITHFTKNFAPPSVSVKHNSKKLDDCKEQLLRDGYRLDEISDEEDLDLIPPRSVEDRCQCCGAISTQGCVVS